VFHSTGCSDEKVLPGIHRLIYWSGMDGISNVAMDGTDPGVFINTTGPIENLAIDLSGAYL